MDTCDLVEEVDGPNFLDNETWLKIMSGVATDANVSDAHAQHVKRLVAARTARDAAEAKRRKDAIPEKLMLAFGVGLLLALGTCNTGFRKDSQASTTSQQHAARSVENGGVEHN